MVEYWAQKAFKPSKRGRLHKQLGISEDEQIPKSLLKRVIDAEIGSSIKNPTKTGRKRIKVTRLLKQRCLAVYNINYGGTKMKKKGKKKGKKWGKIGSPKSDKRKKWLKSIRKKR
jgi:hypothetical protein